MEPGRRLFDLGGLLSELQEVLGRVVYALGQAGLYELTGPGGDRLLLACRDVRVSGRGVRPIEVIGPALEEEALQVHLGFWVK
jgi:tRNA(adenine34) deaminase